MDQPSSTSQQGPVTTRQGELTWQMLTDTFHSPGLWPYIDDIRQSKESHKGASDVFHDALLERLGFRVDPINRSHGLHASFLELISRHDSAIEEQRSWEQASTPTTNAYAPFVMLPQKGRRQRQAASHSSSPTILAQISSGAATTIGKSQVVVQSPATKSGPHSLLQTDPVAVHQQDSVTSVGSCTKQDEQNRKSNFATIADPIKSTPIVHPPFSQLISDESMMSNLTTKEERNRELASTPTVDPNAAFVKLPPKDKAR